MERGRPEGGRITRVDLKATAEQRYLSYALSVITARALPDVRDGLKPVQRRILYAMYRNLRLTAGGRPRKSAAVVGEVLGKYHPHGDQATYEAMVRMAQPFVLRYPLVHGEGNFGSLDGDGAAAMRYTEARLTPIAETLLAELDESTVDFRDTYDASGREPVVLPAALPNLLVNGSAGIAVGMATRIPPHNLREVVDALRALIARPGLSTRDLCRHIRGPDFPTGGRIVGRPEDLVPLYETGRGTFRVRGEVELEVTAAGARLVVTSIPYGVRKSAILEEIAAHITSGRLPQARDLWDESTDAVRIIVAIDDPMSAEAVRTYQFRHTSLETPLAVDLTALVPGAAGETPAPVRLSLRELCREFLRFRLQVVTRRLEAELAAIQTRLHVLAALTVLFADLDRALRLIRAAASTGEARTGLMAAFDLDRVQADAILDTPLYRLARLEVSRLENEQRERRARVDEVSALLADESRRWQLIDGELRTLAATYGDDRRTSFGGAAELDYDPNRYVVDEAAVVVVTRDLWVRRAATEKAAEGARLRPGDRVLHTLSGRTRDLLALWTNRAGLFATRLADIPSTAGYGAPLQSLFELEDGEFPLESIVVPSPLTPTAGPTTGKRRSEQPADLPAERWLLVTESGRALFWQQPIAVTGRAGRRIARLAELEDVVHCARAPGDLVTVLTRSGTVHTVHAADVPLLARAARGVQLVRLRRGDRIVGVVSHSASIPPVAIGRDGKEHPLVPLTIGKPGESGHEPGQYDTIGLVAGTRREALSGRSRSREAKRRR